MKLKNLLKEEFPYKPKDILIYEDPEFKSIKKLVKFIGTFSNKSYYKFFNLKTNKTFNINSEHLKDYIFTKKK